MTTAAALTKLAGKVGLFLSPVYSHGWSDTEFAQAAEIARHMGVDTLAFKVGDGSQQWYPNARIASIRKAILSGGCGAIPYVYNYGTHNGQWPITQVNAEVSLIKAAMDACDGMAMVDMELEYDGQVAAAERFEQLMRPVKGELWLTTWADPRQQYWSGVIEAIKDCVNCWVPQEYDAWLATQDGQFPSLGAGIIEPAFDLSSEFGPNDPLALAKQALARHENTIWLWEYRLATGNPNLVRAIASAMGKPLTNAAPIKLPTSRPTVAPGRVRYYVIQDRDSLSSIAAKLHLRNWFHQLYLPNKAVLDAAARAHGQPNCRGGNLIYAGTRLAYRA